MAASYNKSCKSKSADFKVLSVPSSISEALNVRNLPPPTGWYNYYELAGLLNINLNTIRSLLIAGIRSKRLTGYMSVVDSKLTRFYNLEEVKSFITPKPPKDWYNMSQLADLYHFKYRQMQNVMLELKKRGSIKSKKFKDYPSSKICDYFNFKQVKSVIDKEIKLHYRLHPQL